MVVATNGSSVVGASAGDSEAWLVRGEALVDLTRNQDKKPLLGGGRIDQVWWKDFTAQQHAAGIKVVGHFSLSLVYGDHEKDKGFFDFWNYR